jgi:NDP-sugar pyrophosphorylase family protein
MENPTYAPDPLDIGYYFADLAYGLPFALPAGQIRFAKLFEAVDAALAELLPQNPDVASDVDLAGVDVEGRVHIGEGTTIQSGVSISGPAYIGKNCSIRHGAQLREGTVLGDGCVVGHAAEVKAAVCMGGSKMQSGVFVGNSLLGSGTRIGSGVIVANRRFDQGEVRLGGRDTSTPSGSEFVGAVLGDFVRLGANVVTAPGAMVGPYTWVGSLTNVTGFVPRAKRVLVKQELQISDKDETPLRS